MKILTQVLSILIGQTKIDFTRQTEIDYMH